MTVAAECYFPPQIIEYPDSDGKPMAEGDIQRDYMIYAIEALRTYFQNRTDVYISGNLSSTARRLPSTPKGWWDDEWRTRT